MVNDMEMSSRRGALREALVASAERMIGERGYQALRARELAQEVGCALGAIYNVFPDLDALIVAVKEHTLDALDSEIARRVDDKNLASGAARGGAVAIATQRMQMLARTYLNFASQHPKQWQALFEHRSRHANEAYHVKLDQIFGHIERPLAAIMPLAPARARRLFAQALFSAVHGIVALGLDQKLGALPDQDLAWQVSAIVQAVANGAAAHPELVPLV
jgi:AcrR family transcriptional regulator